MSEVTRQEFERLEANVGRLLNLFADHVVLASENRQDGDDRHARLQAHVDAIKTDVREIATAVEKMAETQLGIVKGVQELQYILRWLMVKTLTEFDDDDEVVELRRLILAQDGGDDMSGFHFANLKARLSELVKDMDDDQASEDR